MTEQVKLISKKGSTLHDYPYTVPSRKCPHFWIINVTPPGPAHCLHHCLYCYARQAIYSDYSAETLVYDNLPELVERDLKRISLCPPISISNVSDPCQPIPELRAEVKRLIRLLIRYRVCFSLTTKGDPSFLLDLPGFTTCGPKFIAITIEGTADILSLLSPEAPPFEKRVEAVRRLSGLGIDTLIRFDPVFIHLFQALYGRLEFHRRLKAVVEANGMTYATCQELSAEESDSAGLPHCERFLLPFAQKQADGRFKPIEGCTANCHVSCRHLTCPPCGQPALVSSRPFKISYLRG